MRYATIIKESPTATSAAAMAIENKAKVWPPLCGKNRPNATMLRFAAFITISIANNILMAFLFTERP